MYRRRREHRGINDKIKFHFNILPEPVLLNFTLICSGEFYSYYSKIKGKMYFKLKYCTMFNGVFHIEVFKSDRISFLQYLIEAFVDKGPMVPIGTL